MNTTQQQLRAVIEAADHAITAEDFDTLMNFYAEDATLVIMPGRQVTGRAQIRQAFTAIADHFNHSIVVKQGEMQVVEGAGTALVLMQTILETMDQTGLTTSTTRRATYVFRKEASGTWLCVIDNSYGTDLLDA